ncbi:Aspartic proteinase 36, partial [Linum perenne]
VKWLNYVEVRTQDSSFTNSSNFLSFLLWTSFVFLLLRRSLFLKGKADTAMDLRRSLLLPPALLFFFFFYFSFTLSSANLAFQVHHKFAGAERKLSALRAHDLHRHGRHLAAVDIPLGGNGIPVKAGLYYTKIGLGTPPKDYYVQVDTGSDTLWVNCVECSKCPTESDLRVKLSLFDPKSSSSASRVSCDDDFCVSTFSRMIDGCTKSLPCQYSITYGDGSETAGFYVRDNVQLDQVTGNLQTGTLNGSVVFGCAAQQSGQLGTSTEALDGIIGFGQANSSLFSQLAASRKVKRVFSHCLDNVKGGGIFAIGEVVSPKVATTPMIPNQAHYNVGLKEVEVDGEMLDLPTDIFDTGDRKGTIIDSGTTLAYLPEVVYESMMSKILAKQPGLKLHTVEEQFSCFQYNGKVDDGFPVVKFHFEDSLNLAVHPHDYLFYFGQGGVWCFGWQSSGAQSKESSDMILLGDLVLSNKLVVYDLENQVIGWTDYNCSSSIKVKDEKTGAIYQVVGKDISVGHELKPVRNLTSFMLLLIAVLYRFL